MKLKKTLLSILLLSLIAGLCALLGCSSSSPASSSDEVHYADKDFIASLSKGLEARWSLTDQEEDDSATTIKQMQSYIQAELDELTQYETATFEDTKLQEQALKYINVLKDSYDNVNYSISDKDTDKWQEYVDERSVLIKDFVENYGLTVSEKHQAILDEFIADGISVETKSAEEKAMKKLVKSLDFELAEDDGYGWKTYIATLDNTSDYDIKDISVDVNLLDKEGTIIATEYASARNVAKGKKAKLEFNTDEDFKKIEKTLSYYEVG